MEMMAAASTIYFAFACATNAVDKAVCLAKDRSFANSAKKSALSLLFEAASDLCLAIRQFPSAAILPEKRCLSPSFQVSCVALSAGGGGWRVAAPALDLGRGSAPDGGGVMRGFLFCDMLHYNSGALRGFMVCAVVIYNTGDDI